MSIRIIQGLPLHEDRRPLKPKIVATIGSETSYEQGILGVDGTEIQPSEIRLEALVKGFYDNGVDVIRLNLSHVAEADVRGYLHHIKRAVCAAEGRALTRRPLALLADLEGPKIRFHLGKESDPGVAFSFKMPFRIYLEEERLGQEGATVYLDGVPIGRSLGILDERRTRESIPLSPLQQDAALESEETAALFENAFGAPRATDPGNHSSFGALLSDVQQGLASRHQLFAFVGDGDVVLEVERIVPTGAEGAYLDCRVVSSKTKDAITGNKGFTLKGVDLDIPSFTETDRKKLAALLQADYGDPPAGTAADAPWEPLVVFVGLSFAQTADDVLRARQFIDQELERLQREGRLHRAVELGRSPEPPAIIAKIETLKGYKNRNYILDVADGVMIARGDLGLQVEAEEVPRLQKSLAELCRKRGKPVITATQMLSSMEHSIEPTRAEVTDVFNAVLDGTDAVMTSEETSKGRYPFHALGAMLRIAGEAEKYREKRELKPEALRREYNRRAVQDFLRDDYERIADNAQRISDIVGRLAVAGPGGTALQERIRVWRSKLYDEKRHKADQQETTNSITEAACILAEARGPLAILAATTSGRTARMLGRLRPTVPIVGAAHDSTNMRKLSVCYGVFPICIPPLPKDSGIEEMFQECVKEIRRHAYLRRVFGAEGTVIFTAGTKIGEPGTTNQIAMRSITL